MKKDKVPAYRCSLAEWEIRDLDLEALPELMALEKCAQALPWSEGMLREELTHPDARVFGAFRDGSLGAFAAFRLIVDELWVMNVATHPNMRRLGLARAVLTCGMNQMKEEQISQVLLEVRRGNHAAQKLYTALDFEEIGIRPGYYTPAPGMAEREDAVIMRCVKLT